jgi:hypothetical protein
MQLDILTFALLLLTLSRVGLALLCLLLELPQYAAAAVA